MRLKFIALFITSLCLGCRQESTVGDFSIVPKPVSIHTGGKGFRWKNSVTIKSDANEQLTSFLADFIKSRGVAIDDNKEHVITIRHMSADTLVPKAYYKITSTKDNVEIAARTDVGIFYGIQTFIQMVSDGLPGSITVREATVIEDYPRFEHRGMHLDVGRHMFPVAFIKKYIDLMAHYKFNSFHWHLTEDQGWRIEIKKYPRLSEVAAYRNETVIGYATTKTRAGRSYDGKRYGGYYTQEEIKDVIAYAAARFVTIIPEIEMPGHAQAALAAYPELGCTGGPYETAKTWGIFDDVFCAGKEETFAFLEGVLDEVVTLFPGEYIHIGGDECPKKKWEVCPHCQKRIKKEGLKDEHELQSYFIRRIEKYLTSKGKKVIGWDEILEGGLAPNAVVMSWRGIEGGLKAASENHDVIMTPDEWTYLNYMQDSSKTEPLSIPIYLPISKVYSFEPISGQFTEEQKAHVIGGQCNVWTEYITNGAEAEYMVFPRAIAMAEVLWTTKEQRNFDDFVKRMQGQWAYLDEQKVNYSKHIKH